MKIIDNHKAYIQKADLAYMANKGITFPRNMYGKVFGNGITVIDESNKYEFVEFDEQDDIEFIEKQNYILNYNFVKCLTLDKITSLINDFVSIRKNIANIYNAMTELERQQNEDLMYEYDTLEYMITSLNDIIEFRHGTYQFDLPEGIDYIPFDTNIKK